MDGMQCEGRQRERKNTEDRDQMKYLRNWNEIDLASSSNWEAHYPWKEGMEQASSDIEWTSHCFIGNNFPLGSYITIPTDCDHF